MITALVNEKGELIFPFEENLLKYYKKYVDEAAEEINTYEQSLTLKTVNEEE